MHEREKLTGVTVHIMTLELDKGDILAQTVVPSEGPRTGGNLFQNLMVGQERNCYPARPRGCDHSLITCEQLRSWRNSDT